MNACTRTARSICLSKRRAEIQRSSHLVRETWACSSCPATILRHAATVAWRIALKKASFNAPCHCLRRSLKATPCKVLGFAAVFHRPPRSFAKADIHNKKHHCDRRRQNNHFHPSKTLDIAFMIRYNMYRKGYIFCCKINL